MSPLSPSLSFCCSCSPASIAGCSLSESTVSLFLGEKQASWPRISLRSATFANLMGESGRWPAWRGVLILPALPCGPWALSLAGSGDSCCHDCVVHGRAARPQLHRTIMMALGMPRRSAAQCGAGGPEFTAAAVHARTGVRVCLVGVNRQGTGVACVCLRQCVACGSRKRKRVEAVLKHKRLQGMIHARWSTGLYNTGPNLGSRGEKGQVDD